MSRLYDFKCRTCGTERVMRTQVTGDPGTIICPECRKREPLSWWRSRPGEPFAPPDTTGMVFGPKADELADTGKANTRRRVELDDMQLREEAPELDRNAKRQLRLV